MNVVGLGAWCDFVTEEEYRRRLVRRGGARKGPLVPGIVPIPSELPSWPGEAVENLLEDFKQGISFDVHEFADLDDGRRLTLHKERGFTISLSASGGPAPRDQWRHLTLENLERDVLTTVLPDDDDTQDQHPWEWLAGLLHLHGVEAPADGLRGLPYIVVFSERLRARLATDA